MVIKIEAKKTHAGITKSNKIKGRTHPSPWHRLFWMNVSNTKPPANIDTTKVTIGKK